MTPPLAPTRFADGRALLLAGLRRRHAFTAPVEDILAQWRDFHALGPIAGATGIAQYGVICGATSHDLEYLCGSEVTDFSGVPAGVGRIRIPLQHYAVFRVEGALVTVRAGWQGIFERWLPQSGYQSAHTPDFEVYPDGFDLGAATRALELWVGVRKIS